MAGVLAFVLLLGGGSHRSPQAAAATAPRKIAVLVGIDYYPNLRDSRGGLIYQLCGPVNDAVLLAETLVSRYGFAPRDIHLLLGPNPSSRGCPRLGEPSWTAAAKTTQTTVYPKGVPKQAILEAFQRYLIDEAPSGSVLVFAYSGHGSRWGDARTLVPSDSRSLDGSEIDIVNAELRNLAVAALDRQPLNLTMILDSCFSESSLLRGIGSGIRALPPDPRTGRAVVEKYRRAMQSSAGRGGSSAAPSQSAPGDQTFFVLTAKRYVVLAAASADEFAQEGPWDTDRRIHGYFTGALVDAMRGAAASARQTYRELMEPVTADVLRRTISSEAGRQLPPAPEGDTDLAVLGGEIRAQRSFLVVGRAPGESIPAGYGRTGTLVDLRAGRAAGVTVDSVYDVYDQNDFTFADPKTSKTWLGDLKVTQVAAGTATALVMTGTAPKGSHAVERVHAQGRVFRIKVLTAHMPAAAINSMMAALRTPFAFQLTGGPDYDLAIADSPTRRGYVRAVLRPDQPLGGDFPAGDPQTAGKLAETFTAYAHVWLAASLANPSTGLRSKWNVTQLAYAGSAKTPLPLRGGHPVLRSVATKTEAKEKGGVVEFTFTNTGPCRLYAGLVVILPTGDVQPLPEGTSDDAGHLLASTGQSWVYPLSAVAAPPGIYSIKAVVGTQPLHLSRLKHAGYAFNAQEGLTRDPAQCPSDFDVRDFAVWVDKGR